MPNWKHILFPSDFSRQNCNVALYSLHGPIWGTPNPVARDGTADRGLPGMAPQAAGIDFQAMANDRRKRLNSYFEKRIRTCRADATDG
jgi:hypothetical protein